jgi:nucleotide-binding universal stress UspA family protein
MIARLLVPLDASATSEQALPMAAGLAEQLGGVPVRLLYAFEGLDVVAHTFAARGEHFDQGAWQAMIRSTPTALEYVRSYLEGQGEAFSARGVPVEAVVAQAKTGAVAQTIVDEARREPDTLIVMSTHGRGGLRRALLGSVAQKVIEQATTPVLLHRITA